MHWVTSKFLCSGNFVCDRLDEKAVFVRVCNVSSRLLRDICIAIDLEMSGVADVHERESEGIGMFERLWWWLHQAVAVASGKCVWVCCLCAYSIQSSVGSLLAHTIALLFVSRVLQGRHVARCLPTPANHKFQSRTITPPVCCNLFLGGMTLVHHIGRACFVGLVSLPLALPTNQSSHRNLNANAKPKLHWNTPTPCLSPKLICNVLSC
jgi:hypothetical protein